MCAIGSILNLGQADKVEFKSQFNLRGRSAGRIVLNSVKRKSKSSHLNLHGGLEESMWHAKDGKEERALQSRTSSTSRY